MWFKPGADYAVIGQPLLFPLRAPDPDPDPNPNPKPHPCRHCLFLLLLLLLVLLALLFIIWPTSPDVSLVTLRLKRIRISTTPPPISITILMGLQIKIRNRDFFPLEYKRVRVSIGYRGNDLGKVKVKGSDRIPARGTTLMKAELKVDGARVVRDVVKLIEDVAHGGITFDTETRIKGTLFIFGFLIPIQARMSCEVHVDVEKQTIISQNCYRE